MLPLHVVLLHPQIHWNTGNAGRSCLAAGAKLHLVRPLGFSLEERQVLRAGVGYWPRVSPVVWPDWASFEKELPLLGEPWLFSADARRDFWSADYRSASVLIFGREESGLPQEIRARYAERLVSLPIADPEVRSLNLSTAVGIALYEALRQRRDVSCDPGGTSP